MHFSFLWNGTPIRRYASIQQSRHLRTDVRSSKFFWNMVSLTQFISISSQKPVSHELANVICFYIFFQLCYLPTKKSLNKMCSNNPNFMSKIAHIWSWKLRTRHRAVRYFWLLHWLSVIFQKHKFHYIYISSMRNWSKNPFVSCFEKIEEAQLGISSRRLIEVG